MHPTGRYSPITLIDLSPSPPTKLLGTKILGPKLLGIESLGKWNYLALSQLILKVNIGRTSDALP